MSRTAYRSYAIADNENDIMSADMDMFSDWLVLEMRKNGLTQSELARRAGISRQTISDYINQRRMKPDEAALLGIARALGYSPEVVFRAAGLLPPLSDRHAIAEEIMEYKLAELNEEQLDDVLAYIEFIQAKAKTSRREEKEKKTREGQKAPPEAVKKE